MNQLSFLLLVAVEIGGASLGHTDAAPSLLFGTLYLTYGDSVTSQLYDHTGVAGERTTTPLPQGFPPACSTCDPGAPTEYCEYKDGYCIKLSNSEILVLATNGSVLYRHNTCSARYLDRLNKRKYAIVCQDSSYQLLHLRENSGPELDGNSAGDGVGGILVQAVSRHHETNLYHVDLLPTHIETYDVDQSIVGHIFPSHGYDSCMLDTLALHPTFSLTGRFFLYCSTGDDSKAYFSCLVETQICDELDLCSDPLPSPSGPAGSDTFATACNSILTVYHTDDPAENQSASFGSIIASHTYLDRNTLLIDTGSEQHIVTVDTFLSSNGSGGIVTLEGTTNCSLNKLITPEVYATVCEENSLYSIRLVNKSNGQEFSPVSNLTELPKAINFEVQEPPVPLPNTTSSTITFSPSVPPDGLFPSTVRTTHTQTLKETVTHTTKVAITSTTLPTTTNSHTTSAALSIVIPATAVVIVAFLATVSLLMLWRWRQYRMKRKLQRKPPIEEENRDGDQGSHTLGLTNISRTPSITSGYDSKNSSLTYTSPISDTQPHSFPLK